MNDDDDGAAMLAWTLLWAVAMTLGFLGGWVLRGWS